MNIRILIFMAKIRELFGRRRSKGELDDEMQLHLQMLKERFILQDVTPGDGEAAATRQFGNATLLRERHYEQRNFTQFPTLMRDLRFGLRQLQRNPMLTCVAITSLTLGIGANTAILAAAKQVLFDTLAVSSPHELRPLTWVSGPERPVPPVWGDVGRTKPADSAAIAFHTRCLKKCARERLLWGLSSRSKMFQWPRPSTRARR